MKYICRGTNFKFVERPTLALRLYSPKHGQDPVTGRKYHPHEVVDIIPIRGFATPLEQRLIIKDGLPENKFVIKKKKGKIIIQKGDDSTNRCLLVVGHYLYQNHLVPASRGGTKDSNNRRINRWHRH